MLETTLNYNPYAIIKELYIYIHTYIYIEIIETINIVPPSPILLAEAPTLRFSGFVVSAV